MLFLQLPCLPDDPFIKYISIMFFFMVSWILLFICNNLQDFLPLTHLKFFVSTKPYRLHDHGSRKSLPLFSKWTSFPLRVIPLCLHDLLLLKPSSKTSSSDILVQDFIKIIQPQVTHSQLLIKMKKVN